MPGRKTHQLAGAISGWAYTLYRNQQQKPDERFVETIGGAIGGAIGGVLADVVEPAVSSWHRGPAHSVAVGSGVVRLSSTLESLADTCRHKAIQARAVPTRMESDVFGNTLVVPIAKNPLNQFIDEIAQIFWLLLAGFLNGLAAGYVSHLALDAFTPRGIPLLGISTS